MAGDMLLEAFIGKHADAWRLYVPGWAPPFLRLKLDANGEVFPVREPDLAELDAFMLKLDAPHAKRTTGNGDVELEARGRSAIALAEWLDGLISATPSA